GHRLPPAWLQRGVRNTADMPDLDEDFSATLMHAIGDLAPRFDLLLGIDARRVLIALPLLRDLARLGDQKSGAGALAVIVDRKRVRHHAGRDRAGTGQRRHHEAICKRERAELEGLKKFARRHAADYVRARDIAHTVVHCGAVRNGRALPIAQMSCARPILERFARLSGEREADELPDSFPGVPFFFVIARSAATKQSSLSAWRDFWIA